MSPPAAGTSLFMRFFGLAENVSAAAARARACRDWTHRDWTHRRNPAAAPFPPLTLPPAHPLMSLITP